MVMKEGQRSFTILKSDDSTQGRYVNATMKSAALSAGKILMKENGKDSVTFILKETTRNKKDATRTRNNKTKQFTVSRVKSDKPSRVIEIADGRQITFNMMYDYTVVMDKQL